jgi:hypothetical protein
MRTIRRRGTVLLAAILALAAHGSTGQAAPLTQMGTSNATAPVAAPAEAPAPASTPPRPPAPAPTPPGPVTTPAAADAAAASSPSSASVTPAIAAAAPSGLIVPGPIPIADAEPAPSDHDAVVGHWGIEARRLSPGPYPLTLRPSRGCPSTATAPCTVDLGLIGVRHWINRDLAFNVGVALALGGGKEGVRTLDSYVGGGPQLGVTLLLGTWRHLAVGASPQLGVFFFKPGGGSTTSTVVVDLRAALEGELHFGFVGVPALSVGMATGLGFRYESTPDASVWSIGVVGPTSAWGVLTDLFLRYYL